jgi:16S rRNA (guanine527-N7)-methyltransferase
MEVNEQEFKAELSRVFKENGLASYLNAEKSDKFYLFTKRLIEENEKYNLTAIKEPKRIILNHYADCTALAEGIKKGATLIDVGCGAGFPTIPLAIVREDIKILAIDSTAKRIAFVEGSAALLGLNNVRAEVMRAEDGAKDTKYRESFDYATARAVSEMRVLTELCLPFVKVGGEMLAMKGKNAEFELAAAKRSIAILGGKGVTVESVTLKGEDEILTHPIIRVSKAAKTPAAYPRAYAQITKKPL